MTEQKKKVPYVTNKELLSALKRMETSGNVSEDLHLMLYKMAEKISNKTIFRNYTYIDDMVSEAYMRCLHYITRFDTSKPNPFAYFTTIIHHSFIAFIKREKSYQGKKWNELSNLVSQMESEHGVTLDLTDSIKERLYACSASVSSRNTEEEDDDSDFGEFIAEEV